MIIRIEFHKNYDQNLIKAFYNKPSGTCLDSSASIDITPPKVKIQHEMYISFWNINDAKLIKFYGGRVAINALTTVPGVKKVNVLLEYINVKDRIYLDKLIDMNSDEISNLLEPFIIKN